MNTKDVQIITITKTLLLFGVICGVTAVTFPVKERVSKIDMHSSNYPIRYNDIHFTTDILYMTQNTFFRNDVSKTKLAINGKINQLKIFFQNWECGSFPTAVYVLLEGISRG